MLSLDESWTRHLRAPASLWLQSMHIVEAFNPSQGLSYACSSSRHSLVTRVQLQSVEHNHSGATASCSIVLRAQLRVVHSDFL